MTPKSNTPSTPKSTKPTPKSAIDDLFIKTLKIRDTTSFCTFIKYLSKFTHYSFYNTMLVYIQNPEVEFFGSEGYWKKTFKRTVNESARRYLVLVPFGPVYWVYDLRETQGQEDVQDILNLMHEYDIGMADGKLEPELLESVLKNVSRFNILVYSKALPVGFNASIIQRAYSKNIEIKISKRLKDESVFSSLMHELAHLMLGHLGDNELYSLNKKGEPVLKHSIKGRKVDSTQEELEAETVSYLISRRYGVEPRSAEYLASYIEDEKLLQNISYELLISTADKIVNLFLPKNCKFPTAPD